MKSYPYLVVDARYEKVRANYQVISQGVLLVAGIRADWYRDILGYMGTLLGERGELFRGLQ